MSMSCWMDGLTVKPKESFALSLEDRIKYLHRTPVFVFNFPLVVYLKVGWGMNEE